MTVIAWDGKTLAADKRSADGVVTRTTTKIFRVRRHLLGIAGDASRSREVVAWFKAGAKPADFPEAGRDREQGGTLIVITPSRAVQLFEFGPQPIVIDDPFASIGMGRDAAMAAMLLGCDAVQAVEVASAVCEGCGNGVDTLTL